VGSTVRNSEVHGKKFRRLSFVTRIPVSNKKYVIAGEYSTGRPRNDKNASTVLVPEI
jgi:hypothetical protein